MRRSCPEASPPSSPPSSSPAAPESAPAPKPPLLPLTPAWKTLLGDFVTAPLATDGRRVYVATRDGAVRALDPATGAVAWKAEGLPGRLSAADGVLLVRGEDGTLWSLQPRTGAVRWKTETGVAGTLPAVVDGDRALVAGRGLAAVDLASGRVLWSDASGAETTAPPVAAGSRLLAGEADGTLRCRDRATGSSLWTLRTAGALLAPPLVDEARRRLYLGTSDKRILEVSLDKGEQRLGLAGRSRHRPPGPPAPRAASSSRPTTPCSTPFAGAATSPGAAPCPRGPSRRR